jgi:hypothetical protein
LNVTDDSSLGDETVNETLHDLLSVWDAEEHICLTHSRLAQLRSLVQQIDASARFAGRLLLLLLLLLV